MLLSPFKRQSTCEVIFILPTHTDKQRRQEKKLTQIKEIKLAIMSVFHVNRLTVLLGCP